MLSNQRWGSVTAPFQGQICSEYLRKQTWSRWVYMYIKDGLTSSWSMTTVSTVVANTEQSWVQSAHYCLEGFLLIQMEFLTLWPLSSNSLKGSDLFTSEFCVCYDGSALADSSPNNWCRPPKIQGGKKEKELVWLKVSSLWKTLQ